MSFFLYTFKVGPIVILIFFIAYFKAIWNEIKINLKSLEIAANKTSTKPNLLFLYPNCDLIHEKDVIYGLKI